MAEQKGKLESSVGNVIACARSLANDQSLEQLDMAARGQAPGLLTNARQWQAIQRGLHDSLAFKRAYHDDMLFQRLAPAEPLSKALYTQLEQQRYESLGANQFKGAGQNLDARVSPQLNTHLALQEATLDHQLGLWSRAVFRADNQPLKETPQQDLWAELHSLAEPVLQQLASVLDNQEKFLPLAATLSRQLATVAQTGSLTGDLALGSSRAGDDDEALDSESMGEEGEHDPAEPTDEKQDEITDVIETDAQAADEITDKAADEAPQLGADPVGLIGNDRAHYRVYSCEFDEIIRASEWSDPKALAVWREQLDQHIELHGRLVRRLARRLQRVLLARQKRQWQFNVDEGQLDTTRLTRIVTEPLVPLAFKQESEAAFRDTTMTLLIDNSRSMMGRPIMIAAACADILARTLEQCGVNVEILGFTTSHLHGGCSTEQWEERGKLPNPGRLNDLRHIVYKSAHTPYRSAKQNLGLMLDKDLLKQNIDGEALLWAHQRLVRRPAQRRILIMISDGAPVDTSTLAANHSDFLAKHLQYVIDKIERSVDVELVAIGIGHDVSRFYAKSVNVFDAKQLGPVLLNQIEQLFTKAA